MYIVKAFGKTHILSSMLQQITLCGEPVMDELSEFANMDNFNWEDICQDCRNQVNEFVEENERD